MTVELIYSATGAALLALGFYGVVIRRHMIRKLMAVNIQGTGVFLLFVSLAPGGGEVADPVAQAMVLTGIVVAVSATAVGLVLVQKIHSMTTDTCLDWSSHRGDEEDR